MNTGNPFFTDLVSTTNYMKGHKEISQYKPNTGIIGSFEGECLSHAPLVITRWQVSIVEGKIVIFKDNKRLMLTSDMTAPCETVTHKTQQ